MARKSYFRNQYRERRHPLEYACRRQACSRCSRRFDKRVSPWCLWKAPPWCRQCRQLPRSAPNSASARMRDLPAFVRHWKRPVRLISEEHQGQGLRSKPELEPGQVRNRHPGPKYCDPLRPEQAPPLGRSCVQRLPRAPHRDHRQTVSTPLRKGNHCRNLDPSGHNWPSMPPGTRAHQKTQPASLYSTPKLLRTGAAHRLAPHFNHAM